MVSQSQANTLKAYDAIAPLYAEYSGKYQNYLNAVDQLVINRLTPNLRLLDIGSGDGRRLRKITSQHLFCEVLAVEPSGEMATLCRKTTGFAVHQLFGDELDQLSATDFDMVTLLWNVFGHMAASDVRLKTLSLIKTKLKPNGSVLLDVNNRHNRLAYGRWNVLKRRTIDCIAFNEKRGDVHYQWKIGKDSVASSGHLFTPNEMADLFKKAGFKIAERWSVNYANGQVSASPFDGQLFYRLEHA